MAAKVPYPRQLNATETLDSLTHWKSHVRNYFRRDENLKLFFARTTTWNFLSQNYGFTGEEASLKADYLEGLLDTIAGFMPGPYLTAQLTKETKSMEDVFSFIWKHYDVDPNPSTFLDFDVLSLAAEERYIDLYYRMLYHADQHLVTRGDVIDGVEVTENETLTHSHKNLIALNWIRSLDKNLVAIVKLEKHKELKEGRQLYSLVHDIAKNVDEWLRRHGFPVPKRPEMSSSTTESTVRNVRFDRNYSRGTGRGNSRGQTRLQTGFPRFQNNFSRNQTDPSYQPSPARQFCPGCNYLAQELHLDVNYRHLPSSCPRKRSVLRMLHSEEQELQDAAPQEDQQQEQEQFDEGEQVLQRLEGKIQDKEINTSHLNNINAIWKSKSPSILVYMDNQPVVALIDEGSEISALDSTFADKLNLPISSTAL